MREHQYRPGSKQDFDRLYKTSYQRIFRTLTAILGEPSAAEDCTQEAFLSAFRAWGRWKADAPPEAWIHRIAINTAISYQRKRRLRDIGELVRRLGAPSDPDPAEAAIDSDLLRELRRLPSKHAAALILRHLHGYTNREIARALGISESTVASRLMGAKRALRARLGRTRRDSSDTSEELRGSCGN
ncbi:MAG: RNA polymerase sigma factor [Actinomycetota bacterium]|nr:RNA polymerase sigma factor [Candidatus Dormibacteraeota bacterium]MDQ6945115.1 RNA polymerase sigma factor [Actinomycetota bacterium]